MACTRAFHPDGFPQHRRDEENKEEYKVARRAKQDEYNYTGLFDSRSSSDPCVPCCFTCTIFLSTVRILRFDFFLNTPLRPSLVFSFLFRFVDVFLLLLFAWPAACRPLFTSCASTSRAAASFSLSPLLAFPWVESAGGLLLLPFLASPALVFLYPCRILRLFLSSKIQVTCTRTSLGAPRPLPVCCYLLQH